MLNAYEEAFGSAAIRKIRSVGIIPPYEPPDANTDEDSDLSDDEVEGLPAHLPGRILRSAAVVEFEASDNEPEPDSLVAEIDEEPQTIEVTEEEPDTSTCRPSKKAKKVKPSISKWASHTPNDYQLPSVRKSEPTTFDFIKNTISSPLECFQQFFSKNLINHIVSQTNIYGGQKGNHNLNVSYDEICTVVGIMLFSGYHQLPNKRMYWQTDPDCKVTLVTEAMRRRRFEEILHHIHLNDNTNINEDKFYKVRPLFDFLNDSFKQIAPSATLSIDESIIPYYGRHNAKQFIRGKPIRFGYKLWVLAEPTGFMIHAEPYCGSHTRLPDTGLGQGGNVVIGLVEHANIPEGTKLYFDNLFTSVSLLEELSRRYLGGTGTLRENRVGKNMNLPPKNQFAKTARGNSTKVCNGQQTAIRWNDNAVVTILSNCENDIPFKNAQRFSRAQRKNIVVKMPHAIAEYNSNMGGVDLNDQFTAQYRCKIRIKKWWWPLFSWSVDECCVQGWLLYRKLGHNIPLLQFRRQVTLQLLSSFGTPSKRPGPTPSFSTSAALDDIRTDRIGHLIRKGESKYRRCKQCQSRTVYLCSKCQVPLHPDCFENFHAP